jgi:hypothetical protein
VFFGSAFDPSSRPIAADVFSGAAMPRYLVQRSFPQGLRIPPTAEGANVCAAVVANNSVDGVPWVHSYVSEDHRRTFCIYDGASSDAVHAAAQKNGLSVDRIEAVTVLDPYFYRG